MRVKKLKFEPDHLSRNVPSEVIGIFSIREAAYLTKLVGGLSDLECNEVMQDGSVLNREIFNCLTSEVFDPYWENSIDSYLEMI